jgi:hypothetical protein
MPSQRERIVIIADKDDTEYIPNRKRGNFYYLDALGTYHRTCLNYIEIETLREFFNLFDMFPGFSIMIPPDSPWYDEDLENVAGMTYYGSYGVERIVQD